MTKEKKLSFMDKIILMHPTVMASRYMREEYINGYNKALLDAQEIIKNFDNISVRGKGVLLILLQENKKESK